MAAKSPASEGMAGRGDVPIRATACCTVSIEDCTQLASRGFPSGRDRAKRKPATGAASLPGWRPNGARQWLGP